MALIPGNWPCYPSGGCARRYCATYGVRDDVESPLAGGRGVLYDDYYELYVPLSCHDPLVTITLRRLHGLYVPLGYRAPSLPSPYGGDYEMYVARLPFVL